MLPLCAVEWLIGLLLVSLSVSLVIRCPHSHHQAIAETFESLKVVALEARRPLVDDSAAAPPLQCPSLAVAAAVVVPAVALVTTSASPL